MDEPVTWRPVEPTCNQFLAVVELHCVLQKGHAGEHLSSRPTPEATRDKLLPCPFCGGEATQPDNSLDRVNWSVSCLDCGAERTQGSATEVVAAWNRRVSSPPPAASTPDSIRERGEAFMAGVLVDLLPSRELIIEAAGEVAVRAGSPPPAPSGEPSIEAKLTELQRLPEGWDSYDGAPISAAAIAKARAWLTGVAIVPKSSGGIQLEWHQDGYDLEIVIAADGSVVECASESSVARGEARAPRPSVEEVMAHDPTCSYLRYSTLGVSHPHLAAYVRACDCTREARLRVALESLAASGGGEGPSRKEVASDAAEISAGRNQHVRPAVAPPPPPAASNRS